MSRFSKKGIVFAMLLLTAVLLLPGRDAQASAKSKALKAYQKFLSQETIPWGNDSYYTAVPTQNCDFAIAYIDNNKVPELILYNSSDITHIAGLGVVYTYRKGKITVVANIQLDAEFYYYQKKGVYATTYMSSGIGACSYTKIKKGKAKSLNLGEDTYYFENTTKYCYKGKEIKKSKFKSIRKKYVGKTKRKKAVFYKNTEANRSSVLK